MQVRVVTMRYHEGLQGFPEEALHKVTFGKTVLGVSEHFFVHGNVPHLALVPQLGDAPEYANADGYRPRDPNARRGMACIGAKPRSEGGPCQHLVRPDRVPFRSAGAPRTRGRTCNTPAGQ